MVDRCRGVKESRRAPRASLDCIAEGRYKRMCSGENNCAYRISGSDFVFQCEKRFGTVTIIIIHQPVAGPQVPVVSSRDVHYIIVVTHRRRFFFFLIFVLLVHASKNNNNDDNSVYILNACGHCFFFSELPTAEKKNNRTAPRTNNYYINTRDY